MAILHKPSRVDGYTSGIEVAATFLADTLKMYLSPFPQRDSLFS